MRREILKNNSATTLSAAVANGTTTSITVTDGTVFPATGDFRILIGSELMLATARSTNTLTVVRGVENTVAVTHASSDPVTHIMTLGGVHQWLADSVPGFDGSRPPYRLTDASGNTLSSASFTTVNLSTSTITDLDGGIVLRKAGNSSVGDNITALARTKTAPGTLIAGLRCALPRSATSAFPLALAGFRDSGSGKMLFSHVLNEGGPCIQAAKYDSPTVQNSLVVVANSFAFSGDVVWFRAVDDGTNLTLALSHDGQTWLTLFSEARTTYLPSGGDQFIWGANNFGNAFDVAATLVSWSEG